MADVVRVTLRRVPMEMLLWPFVPSRVVEEVRGEADADDGLPDARYDKSCLDR